MLNLELARLKRLPQRTNETWQGDVIRMPAWITDEGDEPFRPLAAIWVAARSGEIGPNRMWSPHDDSTDEAWKALADFAMDPKVGGYRPGRVEVRDEVLANTLKPKLAQAGIEVVHTDDLAALNEVMADLTNEITECLTPGALTGKGVTVERMRRFAEAARCFFRAAPWKHLCDEDLLEIESPKPPRGLRWVTVLGGAGFTRGLGFFESRRAHWDLHASEDVDDWLDGGERSIWSLTFEDITDLPLNDSDLWVDHDLPVASAEAYACATRLDPGGGVSRPDAPTLAYMEGLLAALARSTEEDIDSGRWSVAVETFDSKVTFTLAIPDLLSPPDHKEMMRRGFQPERRAMDRSQAQMHRFLADRQIESIEEMNEAIQKEFVGKEPDPDRFPPRDALESAQDLCYQAFDSFGRRRIQLARQALAVCPDCADAHVLLAESAHDSEEALPHYAEGVAAGERALGEQRFEQDAGHFWGMIDTRPYMRARMGQADCLAALGRAEDAVAHYRELLRLNPGDNQGARHRYLPLLIELGLDDEASHFMRESEDDPTAIWLYARALLTFRREGSSSAARAELMEAINKNPFVVDLLLAGEDLGALPDSYRLGSPEEAEICAEALMPALRSTPGAMRWLASPYNEGLEPEHSGARRRYQKRKRKSR